MILPPALSYLPHSVGMAIATWLATIYSANFLKKKYIIKDKNKIVSLSTLYLVVVGIIGIIGSALQSFSFGIVVLVVMVVTFYLASKKYIEETSEEMPK